MNPDKIYLEPTPILDSDHPRVVAYAREHTEGTAGPVETAVALYYAVRDGIWYDPYAPFYRPEHYRASWILERGRGYCVPKAALLCALARTQGIPARIGFATVRNHLATRQLLEHIGSDLFVYHGFTELYLEGKWVKATPAFNVELCNRHRVAPLEFDGTRDSLFQPYNLEKKQFMEYVEYHGTHADVPLKEILSAWEKAYGRKRVQAWITLYEEAEEHPRRDFYGEDVVK